MKKVLHDKFHRRLVDVKIFTAFGEISHTAKGLVNGGHFKSREIIDIFMAPGKFIGHGPQGCLGIAAGTDDIRVLAESCPQVHRRYGYDDLAIRVVNGHNAMDALQILEIFRITADPEAVAAHISALFDIGPGRQTYHRAVDGVLPDFGQAQGEN